MTTAAASPPSALIAHLDALEDALRAAVGTDEGGLAAAGRYVMGWEDEEGQPASTGGKRIRPALCLLAAEALGGSAADAMPGAVAVELVHNFSLVHDEIQDRDAERHHRPTIWRIVGEAQAINVGDFLLTRALRALAESDAPSERRVAALDALLAATDDMIGGQWNDLSFEPRRDVSIADYLAMVEGKTGALIGAPLQMGAILSGAPAAQSDGIRDWGRKVGLAFQVRDDILGIWGDPNVTGKSNQNDMARHKKTLPVIAALAEPHTRAAIRAAVRARRAAGGGDRCGLGADGGGRGEGDGGGARSPLCRRSQQPPRQPRPARGRTRPPRGGRTLPHRARGLGEPFRERPAPNVASHAGWQRPGDA